MTLTFIVSGIWVHGNAKTIYYCLDILLISANSIIRIFEFLCYYFQRRRCGMNFVSMNRSLAVCAVRFRTVLTGKLQLSRIPFPNTTGMSRGNPLLHAASLDILSFPSFFIAINSSRPVRKKSVSSFLHRPSVHSCSTNSLQEPVSHPVN